MDRLSSCYFCGDAVDAALEEYPLVDPRRHPDVETDQRIVLCPSCRRKLTNVIERVLESALNGDEPDVEADGIADLGDEEELVDLDGSLDQADNGEEMTATSVETVDDSASEHAYSSSTAAGDLSGDDETAATDDTSTADDERTTAEEPSATEAGTSTEADDDTGATGDQQETAQQTRPEQSAYSRAEHNKVVKLLQNREFPVEIEEITVVARSAYGIDRDTTHAILDALIERGVVEDQGDRLVRA